MKIGFGTATLPVPPGTPLGGYADRDAPSTGVLDQLEVNCVSICSPRRRLALVVADLVGVNADLATAVADRVGQVSRADCDIPVDTWTMATHTHSGPDLHCRPGGASTPPIWTARIAELAADTAGYAFANASECSITLHTGTLHGIGAVRADRQAVAAVPVDVLSFLDGTGVRRGVLAVVPVHPTVLPATNLLASGDLAASIRAGLRARLGARCAVVVATGAAGDISTRASRREQTPEECRRLGASAAAQLEELLAGPPAAHEPSDATLADARARIRLRGRVVQTAQLARRRAELIESTAPAGDAATERVRHTELQGIELALARSGAAPAGEYPLELGAARLGGINLAALGAEPFLSLRGMLAERGAPSVLFGYTNGYAGYLPDAPAYDRPGYEVYASPFQPDAAAAAVSAMGDLLAELANDGGNAE